MTNDNFIDHHVALTGRDMDGRFMFTLYGWLKAAEGKEGTPHYGGHAWIAYTWPQWCDHLGWSRDQLRGVFARMKARGFLVSVIKGYAYSGRAHLRYTNA